jgi:metal-responsive CopG/Arc/MetJ family transcriptional regulator
MENQTKKTPKVRTSISIDSELLAKVRELADSEKSDVSKMISLACENLVKERHGSV